MQKVDISTKSQPANKRLISGPMFIGTSYFSSHLLPIPKVFTITFETLYLKGHRKTLQQFQNIICPVVIELH